MEITPEFAYWLGVVQTDGSYFTGLINKHKKNPTITHKIVLEVSEKSKEMMEKFVKISSEILGSKATIRKRIKHVNGKDFNTLYYTLGIKSMIQEIKEQDINLQYTIPPENFTEEKIVGAYIAGVIDGDGSVGIEKNRRHNNFKCRISVACNNEPKELREFINKNLNCSSNYRKEKRANAYVFRFLVSRKNKDFLKQWVLPQIVLSYKREKIEEYLNSKGAS